MWAYHTVQNILEQEKDKTWTNDHIERRQSLLQAFQLASQFGFLTPLTDLHLNSETLDEQEDDDPFKVGKSTNYCHLKSHLVVVSCFRMYGNNHKACLNRQKACYANLDFCYTDFLILNSFTTLKCIFWTFLSDNWA
jgi:hypothetical protein